MLPIQFFGQNIHFAISLFAALVCFAVFWLYFDAWTNKHGKKELFKWAGFLLVSLSFVVYATIIEQSVLGKSLLGNSSEIAMVILRLVGYISIIIGQIMDPLQPKPKAEGLDEGSFTASDAQVAEKIKAIDDEEQKPNSKNKVNSLALTTANSFGIVFALPLLAFVVAGLYLRRATTGLERHLKPVAIAFMLLGSFELLSLTSLLRGSANPTLSKLVAAFGVVWIAQHVLLLSGVLVLGKWVWHYLTERFMSQLFMVFTTMTLAIFLLTTVSFTFLLMRNVQNAALNNLETAVNVLNYAIDGKKAETQANAEAVAQNPDIARAIVAKDHKALAALTSTFLETKKQSSLVITNNSGQVLQRAEDPDRWGDSISKDTLIRRALVGQSSSSISSKEDVLAPLLYIKTAIPIRDAKKQLVGAVVVSLVANNAFVDGIKRSTGLDSAVYSANVRSATTLVAPDGTSRWVGVKETNKGVTNTVLKNGKIFKGTLNILNRPFLAVYSPLKDIDNTTVGMLFIGQPQTTILQTAGRSIELTFLVAVTLLIFSIIPAYLISKYLTHQLE